MSGALWAFVGAGMVLGILISIIGVCLVLDGIAAIRKGKSCRK